MTESNGTTKSIDDLWQEALDIHTDFMLAQMFGDEEQFEELRVKGLASCLEIAKAFRAGAPAPEGVSEEEREAFLAEWPEGETLEDALAKSAAVRGEE